MENKLELKHITPYLPYGLECIIEDEFSKYKDFITAVYLIDECISFDETQDWYFNGENEVLFKPILRPLIDLTKEITHNSEKFVPYKKICELDECTEYDHRLQCFYNTEMDWNWDEGTNGMPYWLISTLHEWHFDTEKLIEKGLAIDINTIQ